MELALAGVHASCGTQHHMQDIDFCLNALLAPCRHLSGVWTLNAMGLDGIGEQTQACHCLIWKGRGSDKEPVMQRTPYYSDFACIPWRHALAAVALLQRVHAASARSTFADGAACAASAWRAVHCTAWWQLPGELEPHTMQLAQCVLVTEVLAHPRAVFWAPLLVRAILDEDVAAPDGDAAGASLPFACCICR